MSETAAMPQVGALKVDTIRGFRDRRGVLFPAELPPLLGFAPVRLFWITDVPAGDVRGGHGHRLCKQYLICCDGRIEVEAFDGAALRTLVLEPGQGVLLAPGIYATQTFAAGRSVLLVLCDQPYDAQDYIHSHEDLIAFRAVPGPGASS